VSGLARIEAQTDEENPVLHWARWWNSTEAMPNDVSHEQVAIEVNTDGSTRGLSVNEIILRAERQKQFLSVVPP
jgi:hypothetical protein